MNSLDEAIEQADGLARFLHAYRVGESDGEVEHLLNDAVNLIEEATADLRQARDQQAETLWGIVDIGGENWTGPKRRRRCP